ncbi:hypothetical protein C479_13943 [Halovivax asiaticus JCM 14624]|uniref:Uncharacterized protein n=1 Tax=Halovivax asiaticus JCM 14624 TaxID=1227490 RepID=M0BC10_9EURY|nr:hypothetical protein C479_13943 [Halovivax asiaticus JCM 14624]
MLSGMVIDANPFSGHFQLFAAFPLLAFLAVYTYSAGESKRSIRRVASEWSSIGQRVKIAGDE